MQIFSTSPRGWRPANPSDEERQKFKRAVKEYSVSPTYFHASYLINLAGSGEVQEKSVGALIAELKVAGRFGIKGTTVHLGSFKKGRSEDGQRPLFEEDGSVYENLFDNIRRILKETPQETLFIIENMGTRKIGKRLEELAFILEKIDDPRVRICLDTCHLHAAGVDISKEALFEKFLKRFDELIGVSLLEFIHLNDSRDEFGSLRDRHENIGEGKIPGSVFSLIVNHPRTRDLPFISEVPGFDGRGPDRENLERIRSFVKNGK